MRFRLRKFGYILVGLLILLAGGGGILYWCSQTVPEFYEQARRADPRRAEQANDQFLQRAGDLASDVDADGKWQALFTAEQINGWLAVDLQKNHAKSIPSSISDPRIHLAPGEATLACRYTKGGVTSVITLSCDVFVAEPSVVTLHIHRARAGSLPVPLSKILDGVTQAAKNRSFRLRWLQSDGDPVAEITLPPKIKGKQVAVEVVEIRDGEIFMAGHTDRASSPITGPALRSPLKAARSPIASDARRRSRG